ncbi:MAG: MBL fold metallo-hydrolase [Pseudomonadota bacterium]|nr:MBL fold metallo-hydrolase [Pseudomonadota bacterium]
MAFSRRYFLSLGAAALAAGCATRTGAPAPQSQPASAPVLPTPGWRRFSLGGAEVIALNDGVVRRPLDAGFVRNASLPQVQQALADAGLPTAHIDVPYTAFLLQTGGQRVLLDAGFADNGPPGTGRLLDNLRAAGLGPDDVDAVVLSHLHGDHVNGLRRKDGSLVYPRATVYVPAPEYAYWMDETRAATSAARRVLQGYPAERLRQFTPGEKLLGAIASEAAFGHSPGHTLLAVQGTQERFTYLGDVAHYPALFVRHPDWQVMFDMNPEAARATRRAVLARMAGQPGLVGGYHFPFPAVGRIEAADAGYRLRPA